MSKGKCAHKWITPLLLAVASLLLLLVNLGVDMGGFNQIVLNWWPVALLVFALGGLCPCHGGECCKDGKCE